jgi:hypothetical protein
LSCAATHRFTTPHVQRNEREKGDTSNRLRKTAVTKHLGKIQLVIRHESALHQQSLLRNKIVGQVIACSTLIAATDGNWKTQRWGVPADPEVEQGLPLEDPLPGTRWRGRGTSPAQRGRPSSTHRCYGLGTGGMHLQRKTRARVVCGLLHRES